MARPRKSNDTRQQLLTIGSQMLTEQGYHGTGIKQVLDVAGVPKGSFYNFFPSKEAYVASSIYHYGEQVAEELKKTLEGLESEPALVQLWCSFYNKVNNRLKSGESCACLLGAMSAEIAQASLLCREAVATIEHDWVESIANLVNSAQQQGDIRKDITAIEMASILYNCWQGCLLQYQVSNSPALLLNQLNTAIRTLLTQQGMTNFTRYIELHEELPNV